MRKVFSSLFFVLLIVVFSGCSNPPEKHISKATFNGHWPFYSSSGTLTCYKGAVLFNGQGVNGTAKDRGYTLIDGIPPWGDIIDEGLKLCK